MPSKESNMFLVVANMECVNNPNAFNGRVEFRLSFKMGPHQEDLSKGFIAYDKECGCHGWEVTRLHEMRLTSEVFEAIRKACWWEEPPTDEDVWGVLEGHLFYFKQDAERFIQEQQNR